MKDTFNEFTNLRSSIDNQKMHDYQVSQKMHKPFNENRSAKEIVKKNKNIHVQDGVNAKHIDKDSKLKLNAIQTNNKMKTQYKIRDFHAAPDFSRGLVYPSVELQLIAGEQTGNKCNAKYAEIDYDRFTPFVDRLSHLIEDESKSIQDGQPIGQSSKDIFLSKKK